MALYVGLMSGTSMDGVDAALAEIDDSHSSLVATHSHPIPAALRDTLFAVASGNDDLERLWTLDAQIGELFAEAVLVLIASKGCKPSQVTAIGSHGQTVRHRPPRFTAQIGDPNIIAERTGITTVADFRRRDIAAGGQGAPLAPAFHRAVLHAAGVHRAVLNIGGMANLTVLPAGGDPVTGFDTGPGNVLLDAWAAKHLGTTMDKDGRWARSGRVIPQLLAMLEHDPFFAAAPPKSTGREHFNLPWLERQVAQFTETFSPQDTQHTLCELTVNSVGDAIERFAGLTTELFVCGGGCHNPLLMQGLAQRLPNCRVATTASAGLDPDWVEAVAFAWLAKQSLEGKAGNLPSVTGARRPVVLGGIYSGKCSV